MLGWSREALSPAAREQLSAAISLLTRLTGTGTTVRSG
jgi:hypothetical protein